VRRFPRTIPLRSIACFLAIFGAFWAHFADAAQAGDEDKLPVPRFVSIGADRANVRTGPGERYPIDWVFVKKGIPVEVVAEFGNWRKIRDVDGSVGWVYRAMLSGQRNAVITGGRRAIHAEPDSGTRTVFFAEAGVMARLRRCRSDWCEISTHDLTGWIPKTQIWGALPDEAFE
jgi:SH3-like domain-containing protein